MLRPSAADLVVRAPVSSSENAGSRDPAEFRRRHRALRPFCCSASHRAGSLEPTRRRRASAAPRARRCCDRAPPTSSCVRRSRRRKTRGLVTPPNSVDVTAPCGRSAALPATAPALSEPTRRRRASAAPRARRCCDRAPPTSSCVRRSRRRKTRGLVTPPNSVDVTAPCGRSAALPATAPALLSRHGDGERAPRREHVVAATERRRPRRACAGLVVGKRGVS